MKKIILFILTLSIIFPATCANAESEIYIGEYIVREAALWLGTPYASADGNDGYGSPVDCSGLVMQVYDAFGIKLPRTSALQAEAGELVSLGDMLAGDIVCFLYEDGSIGHVGIYVGGSSMIHAPRPDKCVEISTDFIDWESIKAVYGRRIDVNSDYVPAPLPEEIEEEISALLSMPNSLLSHEKDAASDLLHEDTTNESIPEIQISIPKEVTVQIDNPIMLVNDIEKYIDESRRVSPCIINNRTHLPLRSIAEEFGAQVIWVGGENGELSIKYNNKEIRLWVNADYAMVNGKTIYIDSAPIIINERTYLPIRFIADEFGWNVIWNGDEKTVTLSGYGC